MDEINNLDIFKGLVNWRIKKNKNCIIIINGATGGGKSYASIEIARQLAEDFGTNFSIKTNLAFKFDELLKKMMLPENKKAGTPFIFEEVGVMGGGAAAREWQSKANKFFFSFVQTARSKNQVLIFNCPLFSSLDVGARSLTHIQLISKGIDFQHKVSYFKPYTLQINSRTGKIYFKYPRYRDKSTKFKTRLKEIPIHMPPEGLVEEYERDKAIFVDKLNVGMINGEKTPRKLNLDRNVIKVLSQNGFTNKDIAEILKANLQTIQAIKREEKKLGNY